MASGSTSASSTAAVQQAACRYKSEGCTTVSETLSHHNEHDAQCHYRPINCQALSYSSSICTKGLIKYGDFLEHLINDHQIPGIQHEDGVFIEQIFCDDIYEEAHWKPLYIKFDGRIFFRRCHLMRGILYWWFTMIGTAEDAKKYRAFVGSSKNCSLGCDTVEFPPFKLNMPVHPIRALAREVFRERGHHGYISATQLQKLPRNCVSDDGAVQTHVWETNISIIKLKPYDEPSYWYRNFTLDID